MEFACAPRGTLAPTTRSRILLLGHRPQAFWNAPESFRLPLKQPAFRSIDIVEKGDASAVGQAHRLCPDKRLASYNRKTARSKVWAAGQATEGRDRFLGLNLHLTQIAQY